MQVKSRLINAHNARGDMISDEPHAEGKRTRVNPTLFFEISVVVIPYKLPVSGIRVLQCKALMLLVFTLTEFCQIHTS